MEIKLFEVRDSATLMPVMAIRLTARTGEEHWLLRRAGYSAEQIAGPMSRLVYPYIILCKLDGVEAQYDPYQWTSRRTLPNAHQHMIEHWHELNTGDVIDVQFLLKETSEPKKSERFGETNIVRTLEETDRIVP